MKVRVKFTKTGPLRFIGHLDLLRYFQKAVRRSGIDASYSAGFSPHMIMSFAEPLGVGLTSIGDYFDMELAYTEEHPCPSEEELIQRLNDTLSEHTRILSVRRIEDGRKSNGMALLAASSYTVAFPAPEEFSAEEQIKSFLKQPEILAEKKTKSGTKTENIKPFLYKMEVCPVPELDTGESSCAFSIFCASGSAANLKPDAVCRAFFSFCGLDIPSCDVHARRDEMYAKTEDGSFVSLEALGMPLGECGM